MDSLSSVRENKKEGENGSPRMSRKACPHCAGAVALDSPHVRIARGGISVYCSEACLRDVMIPMEILPPDLLEVDRVVPVPRMSRAKSLFVFGLGIASISPCASYKGGPEHVDTMVMVADKSNLEPALHYGPNPPTDEELAEEFAASLGKNGWVHPLPGPERRMPIRQSRAFGAERPGHRPFECRSGHCGVDIGGAQWGEPILASSAAVVEKVNRDPNRSGGLYVRLSHHEGTVFTQYFHLAAIPKRLSKGNKVRAGSTIGLLGETGVENSGPHLHFTVSVKSSPDAPEVYIDPEPLIALWPTRQLDPGQPHEVAGPGVPIGATGRYKHTKQAPRKASVARASATKASVAKAKPPEETPDLTPPAGFGSPSHERADTPIGPEVSMPPTKAQPSAEL